MEGEGCGRGWGASDLFDEDSQSQKKLTKIPNLKNLFLFFFCFCFFVFFFFVVGAGGGGGGGGGGGSEFYRQRIQI